MSEKRFNIVPSNVVEDGKFIQDNKKEHSFPTTKDTSTLVMYEKALNELATKCSQLEKENEQLKKEKEEIKSKAENFVELYERDFGKRYDTPPKSGKTIRPQLWIVRKILDEIGILELYGDVE